MSSVTPAPGGDVTVPQIFRAFLLIGATSFGGGVVAYLHSSLVEKHRWIDDRTFVECLAIGQTLPGLNATNMSVLVGDRLRGAAGAFAAVIGMCLPGALLMFAAGVAYGVHGNRSVVIAAVREYRESDRGRCRSGGRPSRARGTSSSCWRRRRPSICST